jgi:hypothetical protein
MSFYCSGKTPDYTVAHLTSTIKKAEHHITVPAHNPLKVGTLNGILGEVASYQEIDRKTLIRGLFK